MSNSEPISHSYRKALYNKPHSVSANQKTGRFNTFALDASSLYFLLAETTPMS
jgi:hypothetical protein